MPCQALCRVGSAGARPLWSQSSSPVGAAVNKFCFLPHSPFPGSSFTHLLSKDTAPPAPWAACPSHTPLNPELEAQG